MGTDEFELEDLGYVGGVCRHTSVVDTMPPICAQCGEILEDSDTAYCGQQTDRAMSTAPARTEKDGDTFMRVGGHWCTEAEQAVLDAVARASIDELVALCNDGIPDTPQWETDAARAELARRGIAP